jgi:uncharacterized protein YneR
MSFNLNDWLKDTIDIEEVGGVSFYQRVRPRIVCQDGYSVSVQASEHAYCTPRYTQFQNDDGWHVINGNYWMTGKNERNFRTVHYVPYEEVELGFPSEEDELINKYAEDEDYTHAVYPYTPVDVVEQLIEKHGGFKCTERRKLNGS